MSFTWTQRVFLIWSHFFRKTAFQKNLSVLCRFLTDFHRSFTGWASDSNRPVPPLMWKAKSILGGKSKVYFFKIQMVLHILRTIALKFVRQNSNRVEKSTIYAIHFFPESAKVTIENNIHSKYEQRAPLIFRQYSLPVFILIFQTAILVK